MRAINVGGHGKVAMADLRDLFADLGFAGARTLLQTGNVVFHCDPVPGSHLEDLLQKETAERLGLRADCFVRTAGDWAEIVDRNPFPEFAERHSGYLTITFLKQAPSTTAVEALRAAIKGPEEFAAIGRHAYIAYPDGIGRSKLTGSVIESKLGTRGTARNWNTVLKIAALAREQT